MKYLSNRAAAAASLCKFARVTENKRSAVRANEDSKFTKNNEDRKFTKNYKRRRKLII
jgi:hypothetical protein